MLAAAVLLALVLAPTSATVNCAAACKKCTENKEHFALLEVYCAMCQECRERRRDWMNVPRNTDGRSKRADSSEELPQELAEDDCPTPPPCPAELDQPEMLKSIINTTTTTPTPSTTTKQCTPAPNCQPKQPGSCCIPMCVYPAHPFCPPQTTVQKLVGPETTPSTTKGYYYVHVGVPKDLLNSV